MENVNPEPTDQIQVNPAPVSTKKTIFKPFYLLVITVLVIAVLVVVVMTFLPKSKTTDKITESTNKTTVVQKAVEKAGYKVSWNGNTSDSTGRSIIANDKRETSTIISDSIALANPEQDPQNITFGLGVFKEWETIPNSKDVYMILENPLTKRSFKGRITFEDSLNNLVNNKNTQTLFLVEDMNYGPTTKESFAEGYYFLVFQENAKENSQKAIKAGDVVGARGLLVDTAKQVVKKDDNGIFVIHKVFLRRFGGAGELFQELK